MQNRSTVPCRKLGLLALLLGGVLVLALLRDTPVARADTTVLYDGSVAGETLADQGFFYLTRPPVTATTGYSDGGTTLISTANPADYAGFSIRPEAMVPLDRQAGFTLQFTLQILDEIHSGEHRAGLSVIVLASDLHGIELSFWADELWVQNDGAALFTHGEGIAFDTTERVAYALQVQGDSYSLFADGVVVLSGSLRNYSASPVPVYSVPNYIWMGDNTSQAGAHARIFAVAVEREESATPTPSSTATPTPTATYTATSTPTSAPTSPATPTHTPTPRAQPDTLNRVYLPLLGK